MKTIIIGHGISIDYDEQNIFIHDTVTSYNRDEVGQIQIDAEELNLLIEALQKIKEGNRQSGRHESQTSR